MLDMKKFGNYIAHQRKCAHLTQEALAEKLCLTRQAISKYERGDSFPDIAIVLRLAKLFNLTVEELITAEEIKNETNNIDNAIQIINAVDYNTPDIPTLEKIVPYVDTTAKELLLKKIIDGECDWRLLNALLPHMETAMQQVEAAVIDGALPREAMRCIHTYIWKEHTHAHPNPP